MEVTVRKIYSHMGFTSFRSGVCGTHAVPGQPPSTFQSPPINGHYGCSRRLTLCSLCTTTSRLLAIFLSTFPHPISQAGSMAVLGSIINAIMYMLCKDLYKIGYTPNHFGQFLDICCGGELTWQLWQGRKDTI